MTTEQAALQQLVSHRFTICVMAVISILLLTATAGSVVRVYSLSFYVTEIEETLRRLKEDKARIKTILLNFIQDYCFEAVDDPRFSEADCYAQLQRVQEY